MDKITSIQKATISIGIVLGCIPSPDVLTGSKVTSPALIGVRVLMYLHTIAVIIALLLDNLIDLSNSFDWLRNQKASDVIISYVVNAVWDWAHISRRMYYLSCYSIMAETVSSLSQLDSGSSSKGSASKRLTTPRLLVATYLLSGIITAKSIVTAIATLAFPLPTENKVHAPEENSQIYQIFMAFVSAFYGWAAKITSVGLVFSIGQKLAEHYSSLIAEFKSVNFDPQLRKELGLTQIDLPSQWSSVNGRTLEKFQALQKCFELYKKLVGLPVLVAVAENSILTIFYMYTALDRAGQMKPVWGAAGFLGMTEGILHFGLIAYIGEVMKEVMQSGREEVKSALIESGLAFREFGIGSVKFSHGVSAQAMVIAKYVLVWKWKLRVCGILDVGNRLYPLIAGIALTYIMFMFQLIISEETTGFGTSTNSSVPGMQMQ